MVTLAEAIAASQAKFGDAFVKAAGPSGFSLLAPDRQVAAAQSVSQRAAATRSIFAPSPQRQQFIRGQSQDIVNLFKLGSASQDISSALNQNIAIRESQRAETNQSISSLEGFITDVSQRVPTMSAGTDDGNIFGKLGADIQQALTGNRDFLGSPFGAISSTALLVGGGIALLLLLRR